MKDDVNQCLKFATHHGFVSCHLSIGNAPSPSNFSPNLFMSCHLMSATFNLLSSYFKLHKPMAFDVFLKRAGPTCFVYTTCLRRGVCMQAQTGWRSSVSQRVASGQFWIQTPSIDLQHPTCNPCHNWLCHRSADSFSLVFKWQSSCKHRDIFYITTYNVYPSMNKTQTQYLCMFDTMLSPPD